MTKNRVFTLIGIIIAILVCMELVALGIMGGIGPLKILRKYWLAKLPGNADEYHIENVEQLDNSPLDGKRLCFLGSSVTLGASSLEVSFADYIAKRNNCYYVKEAVSGTTLVDNGSNSYIQRMTQNIDQDEQFDVFICQLSTNDATKKMPIGTISDGTKLSDFDTSTVAGAMEYIICYAQSTWNCPVVFFTSTKYDSEQYEKMLELLYDLKNKWNIGIIDLWNSDEMNSVSEKDYGFYMSDSIHPTQAGYLLWWTPFMEECLYEILEKESL